MQKEKIYEGATRSQRYHQDIARYKSQISYVSKTWLLPELMQYRFYRQVVFLKKSCTICMSALAYLQPDI